jgi:hypothetical protein
MYMSVDQRVGYLWKLKLNVETVNPKPWYTTGRRLVQYVKRTAVQYVYNCWQSLRSLISYSSI